MAKAKLVCGECGAGISSDDTTCPRCGVFIEHDSPAANLEKQRETPKDESPSKCEVCGRLNMSSGVYCESCGAQLPGTFRLVQGNPHPGQREKKQQKKSKRRSEKKIEPWQVSAGVAFALLVGFLVYSEISRSRPSSPDAHNNPPAQTAASPAEIEQLQKIVDANPTDGASLLRLANLLHDNATHDMTLFFRAADAYRKYLAIKPNDANAHVDLGICYFQLTKVDSVNAGSLFSMAIGEMKEAFKYDSAHQPAAFNLGIVYLSAGDTEEANKWFKKVVELNAGSELGKRAKNLLEQHAFQPLPN